MLNHALRYLALGFSVIPLRPNGKEPLIKWEEYQKRRPTEAEVRAWWTNTPNANIGIVLGKVSGVIVVDVDGQAGLNFAEKAGIESSVVSLTATGKHLWFKYNGEESRAIWKGTNEHEEVFLRSDELQVVAPPSVHPNGRRYRWSLPVFLGVDKLSAFPMELGNAAVEKPGSPLAKPEVWMDEALEDFKNGHVANTLVSILGKFRAHNFSENSAFLFLKPYNTSGQLTDDALRDKISEIWGRYEPNEVRQTYDNRRPEVQSELVIHSPTNPESWKQFEQLHMGESSDGRTLLNTGYKKLDSMLKGGLKSSRLITVAARTGVGKTNFLLGITRQICESGRKVLLFSTEMPYAQIWERYIQTLKRPEDFKSHQFYVCDSFAPDLERVEEAIKETKPDVFMFDHINHVSEEQKELGTFMQGLNFLRRQYDCAGIVTAQLNRSADWVDTKTGEKVTPRMSMIKGSGTIEQASSRVLLLSETRVTPEYTEIVGNLDKNDNGPKGLVYFGLYNKPYIMREL